MNRISIAVFEDKWLLQLGVAHVLMLAELDVRDIYSQQVVFLEAIRESAPELIVLGLDPHSDTSGELIRAVNASSPRSRILATSVRPTLRLRRIVNQHQVLGLVDPLVLDQDGWITAIDSVSHGVPFFRGTPDDSFPPAKADPLQMLSAREREVLSYVAAGADNLKIAACMGITERTVKAHVSALYRKLSLENRTQLALLAHDEGLNLPSRLAG